MAIYRRGRVYWTRFRVKGQGFRASLRTRDKAVARSREISFINLEQRRALGLVDPLEGQGLRPVEDHVEEFEQTLRSHGVTEQHLSDRMRSLRTFLAESSVARLSEIDSSAAAAWLNTLRDDGLSARTVNRRLQALRQFARWLVATRRSLFDPFSVLRPLNEKADRRHVRRALLPEEIERLFRAARDRPLAEARKQRSRAGVSSEETTRLLTLGWVRVLAYALAVSTGLRRSELGRLRWCDINFAEGVAVVPAESAKARREQRVRLHPAVIAELKAHAPAEDGGTLVIAPKVFPNLRTFKRDLAYAGIAAKDGAGRVVDFHALRTTFVSLLQMSGAHPGVAQQAARHASITTTMAHYTDADLFDVGGAVARLPLPALVRVTEQPDRVSETVPNIVPIYPQNLALPRTIDHPRPSAAARSA